VVDRSQPFDIIRDSLEKRGLELPRAAYRLALRAGLSALP